LGHEAAVQVSVSSSLCGNKKLVHLKLDNQDLNLNESKYKFRKATYEDDDSLLLLTLQLKKIIITLRVILHICVKRCLIIFY